MYRRASWLEQCLQFISTTCCISYDVLYVREERVCSRNVIVSFSYDSYRGGGCTSLICGVFKGERE